MNVSPARGAARESAAKQKSYGAYSFPGPSLGWVSDQNLAMSQPGAAFVLENIFPTATGGILRRGCAVQADLGDPVKSLFTYGTGGGAKLFAGVDGEIFDVSVRSSPASAYSVTNGYWSVVGFTASDGTRYLRGVNGVDTPWVYDGTTFDPTPALTFPGGSSVTPEQLSFVWSFKNRLFFIQNDSLDVWYLAVGNVGGELTHLPLGGIFSLGGHLVFGASWSMETGGGLSSMCLFVTSNGEVAVYQGMGPDDTNTWGLVGIYFIGKPRGPQSFIRRGGDIVVATDIGFIAISQALQKDTPSLSPSAMSFPIEDEWNRFVRQRVEPWAAAVWTEGQMVAIALPTPSGQTPTWLVANARTGRWASFTGWDASCLSVYNGELYFGSPDGKVYQANTGGADDGMPYVAAYAPVFDQLGQPGLKTVQMARPVIRARGKLSPRISVHADFRLTLPPPPGAAGEAAAGVWGVGVWGEATWGDGVNGQTITDTWRNVYGEGEAISVAIQITSATVAPLDAEFIRTDVTFTSGEMQA